MSHTSGPWEFRHVAALPLRIVDARGGVIAFVDRRAHRGDEGMANGHLLKMAPDLLVLAEELIPYLDLVSTERANNARAIVAKAKGETP